MGYHQTNRKTDTGKTLTRWPVLVDHYNVVKLDSNTYRVKVIDEQQKGVAQPNLLIQIDQFDITRQQYNEEYDVGNRRAVRKESLPGFENTIDGYLQNHRDKI